ncbi:MAG: 50S ribosomal protein L21 [Syntrophobacteraceae bacterium]
MYAIFRSGGRQYEARPGQTVKLGKISGQVGESVVLDQVLFFSDGDRVQVGQPLVDGLSIQGKIVEHGRSAKIIIFKHKRRKDYRKKQGHRQDYTAVRVENIG